MTNEQPDQLTLPAEGDVLDRLRQAEQAIIAVRYEAGRIEREIAILQSVVRSRHHF